MQPACLVLKANYSYATVAVVAMQAIRSSVVDTESVYSSRMSIFGIAQLGFTRAWLLPLTDKVRASLSANNTRKA